MNTKPSVRPRNRGFTLIELMIVLTVLGAMMAFAVPGFKEYRRNAALTNTANLLVSSVYRARSEAMKEGVPAILMPGDKDGTRSDGDWTKGWIIFLDRDLSDSYTDGDKIGPDDDGITFVQPGDEIPDYIAIATTSADGLVKFNGAGFPKQKASTGSSGSGSSANSGFGGGTFSVTRTDKGTPAAARHTRRVIISASGRVRTCRPDVAGADACPASSSSSSGSGGSGGSGS